MIKYFDFETEIEKIDNLIKDLNNDDKVNLSKIEILNNDKKKILEKIYSNLTPWQKVQVSRHIDRPHTLDYLKLIFEDLIFLTLLLDFFNFLELFFNLVFFCLFFFFDLLATVNLFIFFLDFTHLTNYFPAFKINGHY